MYNSLFHSDGHFHENKNGVFYFKLVRHLIPPTDLTSLIERLKELRHDIFYIKKKYVYYFWGFPQFERNFVQQIKCLKVFELVSYIVFTLVIFWDFIYLFIISSVWKINKISFKLQCKVSRSKSLKSNMKSRKYCPLSTTLFHIALVWSIVYLKVL